MDNRCRYITSQYVLTLAVFRRSCTLYLTLNACAPSTPTSITNFENFIGRLQVGRKKKNHGFTSSYWPAVCALRDVALPHTET